MTRPDEFLLTLFYALMFLVALFGLFGGLGYLADKLDAMTRKGERRTRSSLGRFREGGR